MSKVRKIAFEEHYTAVGFKDYSKSFAQHIDPTVLADLAARLVDFDEVRLGEMDRAASTTSSCRRPGRACRPSPTPPWRCAAPARTTISWSSRWPAIRRATAPSPPYPCTIPVAAAELERCVRQLGFKGALINGHTNGVLRRARL